MTRFIICRSALIIVIMAVTGCAKRNPAVNSPRHAVRPDHKVAQPARNPKLSAAVVADQTLGINLLNALTAEKGLKGSSISVGTSGGNIMLNGRVVSATQRALADRVVRHYLNRHPVRSYNIINAVAVPPVPKPAK